MNALVLIVLALVLLAWHNKSRGMLLCGIRAHAIKTERKPIYGGYRINHVCQRCRKITKSTSLQQIDPYKTRRGYY